MPTCALTGKEGKFIKSHLLPRSVTNIGEGSEKSTEYGLGRVRAKRRPPGWYDRELVVAEGERILELCDDHGVSELRRCGLLWSSAAHANIKPYSVDEESGAGLADILVGNPKRLRMFFLSLLWRAGATKREEFDNVELDYDEMERLRYLLVNNEVGETNEFVTILVSLVGVEFPHNHTPIKDFYPVGDKQYECTRFYFDGLIIRMAKRYENELFKDLPESLLPGFGKDLTVLTMDSLKSRQLRDVTDVMAESDLY